MKAGRHRGFEKAEALEKALHLFWQNGYSGTSLAELTAVMGINKPSLYAAFGNKEQLFSHCLEHYLSHYGSDHVGHLMMDNSPLRARLKCYLYSIATLQSALDSPSGCFVCNTTAEAQGTSIPLALKNAVNEINEASRTQLHDFFLNEQQLEHVTRSIAAKALANYILTLQTGLAVMSSDGADLATLSEVIDVAIDHWGAIQE